MVAPSSFVSGGRHDWGVDVEGVRVVGEKWMGKSEDVVELELSALQGGRGVGKRVGKVRARLRSGWPRFEWK